MRILQGKYSRSLSSTDIYDKLYEKGLFMRSPQFHVDWAEVHLMANQVEQAKAILYMVSCVSYKYIFASSHKFFQGMCFIDFSNRVYCD